MKCASKSITWQPATWLVWALVVLLCGQTEVQAKDKLPMNPASMEQCIAGAAQFHRVDPQLLKAILMVESKLNPRALNQNANGTRDIGVAQVNTIHLPTLEKHGIGEKELQDGCVNVYVGAWLLSKQIARHGMNWFGIAAYHSTTPSKNAHYQTLVYRELVRNKPLETIAISTPSSLK